MDICAGRGCCARGLKEVGKNEQASMELAQKKIGSKCF